jgi:hypothetical protein
MHNMRAAGTKSAGKRRRFPHCPQGVRGKHPQDLVDFHTIIHKPWIKEEAIEVIHWGKHKHDTK